MVDRGTFWECPGWHEGAVKELPKGTIDVTDHFVWGMGMDITKMDESLRGEGKYQATFMGRKIVYAD